jgi:predicted ATP-binding protein involved in virulence
MIVDKVYFDGKEHKLICDSYVDSGDNTFTVIIGKNGSGKSKLLHKISDTLTNAYNNKLKLSISTAKKELIFSNGDKKFSIYSSTKKRQKKIFKGGKPVSNNNLFKKCICVSTSPFDKFPFFDVKGYDVKGFYQYIGLRTSKNTFSKDELLSFLAQATFNQENKENINQVLSMLGYKPTLDIIFKKTSRNIPRRLSSLVSNKDDFEMFMKHSSSESNYQMRNILYHSLLKGDQRDILHSDIELSTKNLNDSYVSYLKTINSLPHSYSLGEYIEENKSKFYIESLNSRLLKVSNVILEKEDGSGCIDLTEASSGEQCMLLIFLCISAVIENNCVICIDEPEISLHPEWQNEFMPLLMKLFYKFKGCHFIIATHSPQMISKLTNDNSFILVADDNSVLSVNEYKNKSADYQLATLFKSPGFQNEYLNRICVGILSNLSSNKKITDSEKENIHLLNKIKCDLSEDDSVLMLINIINKAMEVYND